LNKARRDGHDLGAVDLAVRATRGSV